jgi:hypothetical protein
MNTHFSPSKSSASTKGQVMINRALRIKVDSRATQSVVSVGNGSIPPMNSLLIVGTSTSAATYVTGETQRRNSSITSTTMR